MTTSKRRSRYTISAAIALILALCLATAGYGAEGAGPGANLKPSTNGVTIYVSKLNKTLTLKQNGVQIATYPVTIGAASRAGDKEVEGDTRTPSGDYYVCTRNDKSIAYLALGLSYPGIPDAEWGFSKGLITEAERDEIIRANEAGEQPPWNTALGGAIEIHGNRKPGTGTLGCVAVDNPAMDVLWQYCNLGVPVTIGP